MKKVICINNGYEKSFLGNLKKAPQLTEGETYTIVEETHAGYFLKEIEIPFPSLGFTKKRFITVSDINETTFERNYQTEKA